MRLVALCPRFINELRKIVQGGANTDSRHFRERAGLFFAEHLYASSLGGKEPEASSPDPVVAALF